MDTTMDRIKNMYLYYWIHLFNGFTAIRNIGIWGDPVIHNSIISIIKFPPIVFMLCNKRINNGIDNEVEIKIKLKTFIRPNGEIRTSKWSFVQDDNRIFLIYDNVKADSVFTVVDID